MAELWAVRGAPDCREHIRFALMLWAVPPPTLSIILKIRSAVLGGDFEYLGRLWTAM